MRTDRSTTHRPSRLRLAAAGGGAALLLVTGCGSDPEPPTPAPAASGEADTAAGGGADAAGGAATPSTNASPDGGTSPESVTVEQSDGGQTQLTLDRRLLDALRALQVEVAPVPPATRTGDTFTFPVRGGTVTVDPGGAGDPFAGTLQHEGGLRLSALGRSAEFTDLVLDADTGQVTAEAGGRRITLLGLDERSAEVARRAGEVVVSGEAATLSSEAAQSLGERLGVPLPQLPDLPFGDLQVTLPAGG